MQVGASGVTVPGVDRPGSIRVVLADDQKAYRDGLARAIEAHDQLDLVAVEQRGDAALHAIATLQPDVALLDVRMAGMDGTAVIAELRRDDQPAETRVVLMSAHAEPALAEHAGADCFVAKDRSRREICELLVRVGHAPPAGAVSGV